MHVHVRLAEPFWRSVGERELSLDLDEGARVSDLLDLLTCRYASLKREFEEAHPHVFLGEEEVEVNAPLVEGCWVHLVWPLAGG